jgi:hypothetical protein
MNAFRQGFQELGWVEGRSFTLVTRFAEGRADRLPRLAASLVQDGVDVIVVGSNPGALAARKATSSIPIVMVTTGDPIGGGIVTSLKGARPADLPIEQRRPSSWSSAGLRTARTLGLKIPPGVPPASGPGHREPIPGWKRSGLSVVVG